MKIKSNFLLLVMVILIQTYPAQAIVTIPNLFLTNPIMFAIKRLLSKSSETSLLLLNNDSSGSKQTPTSSSNGTPIATDLQKQDLYSKEDWEHVDYLIKKKRFKEITQYYEGQNQGVNKKNNKGLTGLHLAVMLGDLEAVKHFLKIGANPNLQDNDGDTPLHIASKLNHADIMHALMDNNADRNIKNKSEKTFIAIQLEQQNKIKQQVKKSIINSENIVFFCAGILLTLVVSSFLGKPSNPRK